MSHTSSGLHASPWGWMNERAVRLAWGGVHWLREHCLCQLLNGIKNVSVCRLQDLGAFQRQPEMQLFLGGSVTDGFQQTESPPSTVWNFQAQLWPQKKATLPRCCGPGRTAQRLGSGEEQDCTCKARNLSLANRRKFIWWDEMDCRRVCMQLGLNVPQEV